MAGLSRSLAKIEITATGIKLRLLRAKGFDGLSLKGFVKRWHKYYLPQALIDELPPKAFVWANGTFEKWGGHYSGLDAWPDAEA